MPKRNYYAYLLRLWRDSVHAPWRLTLENPHSNERLVFTTLADLMSFLQTQVSDEPEVADPPIQEDCPT